MDFIEGLPNPKGKNTIMVVVDKYTKYAHFLSSSHPFDALKIVRLLIDGITKLHGVAHSMLSNRDRIFLVNSGVNCLPC